MSKRSRAHACCLLVLVVAAAALATTGEGASAANRAVTIFAPYRGAEADAFMADVSKWARDHDVTVRYTGTGDIAGNLQFRVTNADPPDIALVPQPGLVAELHRSGDALPLAPAVKAAVDRNLAPGARALGDVDGVAVGVPYRLNLKGLVWYRPSELAALGLEPPRTFAGLDRLVAAIERTGRTPWCFGVEAEGATGWAATDWVENLVVREAGPDVYDEWVDGEVPFSDPRIEASFQHFRDLVLAPGRVTGGVARAIATPVTHAGAHLFTNPPGCLLYQQASFARGWFPSDETVGPDGSVDFFVLPSVDGGDSPMVVGTDIAVAFSGRRDVVGLMRFLASPNSARTWVTRGGFISPQRALPLADYEDPADRAVVQRLRDAKVLVLDGSDTMPPHIGTDLFWEDITKWMAGAMSYDELATDLDASFLTASGSG